MVLTGPLLPVHLPLDSYPPPKVLALDIYHTRYLPLHIYHPTYLSLGIYPQDIYHSGI